MTTRRVEQFASMMFNEVATLRGGIRCDDIFLSEEDASALGIAKDDVIQLHNEMVIVQVQWADPMVEMTRGALWMYWLENNILIERKYDEDSDEPDYNCPVQIRKL